jgi:hypothetical protein
MGDTFTFVAHLSQEIKDFVMEQLTLGFTLFQIMTKHRQHVKNIMLGTCSLNTYMFLIEQDVRVLFGKLVQKNTNYIKMMQIMCVWVQQNINSMFYYQEIGVDVDGGLTRHNMPFTLVIETPWQKEMMIEHGHQGHLQLMQPLEQMKKG